MKTYIVSATIKAYYHYPERKVTHPVKAKDQFEAENKFKGFYKLEYGSDYVKFEHLEVFQEIE